MILALLGPMLRSAQGVPLERQQALVNLLRQDCGSCHGMLLNGGLGPPLLPESLASKSDEDLVHAILDGRPGTAMPPWRDFLSASEAAWLVTQLRKNAP